MEAAKRIVVMDDSDIVLDAVASCLMDRGYAVAAARNLAQLELALSRPPDLLVLDVQMPEMYGYDVAQVLKEVRGMNVPVVLFSDIDDDELAEHGKTSGVTTCVSKRKGLGGLLSQVERILGA